jgi:arylsulfatase
MPTLAELAGVEAPANDGISLVPTMTGRKQPQHDYLYWEFPGGKGWLAVRWGEWKGLVMNVHKGNDQMQLFNLQTDSLETTDVAAEHPEIVEKMWEYIKESHQPVPNDVERYKMTVNFPE